MVMALMLVCTGVAQAAEWADGLSPSRPYENMPEVNLDERLGYMMFFPNAELSMEGACQQLFIYLPREDVVAGESTITLMSEEDGEVWSTAMSNTEAVIQRAITEDELDGLLWGGGTCFEIRLPRTLELGKHYYVNMARGCIVAQNGKESLQISGEESWSFSLQGEYGVSGMEYLRKDEPVLTPQAGDEIRFDLVLGGDAAMAAIYQYNDTADFLVATFTESTEVTGTVTAENPTWGVAFMDEQGAILSQVQFR